MIAALLALAPFLTFSWNGRPIPHVNGELVGLEPGARWTVKTEWVGDIVRLTIARNGLTWDEPTGGGRRESTSSASSSPRDS